MKYRTILADPPWPQTEGGPRKGRHQRKPLPYSVMPVDEIKAMPIGDLADTGAHLWLWVTNEFLRVGFDVMEAWGFKYLAPITWAKPSGGGNYFIHRTEHLLFGYKERCQFNGARYVPTFYQWPHCNPGRHSRKPPESYRLIESISDKPRLELFARPITPMFPKIEGWHTFGNEVVNDVNFAEMELGQLSI